MAPLPNSKPTISQCTILAERLMGFYGAPDVGDPKVFMTGMVELMAAYSTPTVERVPNAVRGIPARFKFFPRIAEIKEAMDEWEAEEQRHRESIQRYARPALADLRDDPPPVHRATPKALCARFGIRDIPPGWDAVDVTRQAHKHGAGFPAFVDKLLSEHQHRGETAAAKVVDAARQAMEDLAHYGRAAE